MPRILILLSPLMNKNRVPLPFVNKSHSSFVMIPDFLLLLCILGSQMVLPRSRKNGPSQVLDSSRLLNNTIGFLTSAETTIDNLCQFLVSSKPLGLYSLYKQNLGLVAPSNKILYYILSFSTKNCPFLLLFQCKERVKKDDFSKIVPSECQEPSQVNLSGQEAVFSNFQYCGFK